MAPTSATWYSVQRTKSVCSVHQAVRQCVHQFVQHCAPVCPPSGAAYSNFTVRCKPTAGRREDENEGDHIAIGYNGEGLGRPFFLLQILKEEKD